jgi:DNA recombination protein RmuC
MTATLPLWLLAILLLLSLALGVGLTWLLTRGRLTDLTQQAALARVEEATARVELGTRQEQISALREQLGRAEALAVQAEALQLALETARSHVAQLSQDLARQSAQASERETQTQAQIAQLTALRTDLEARFQGLADSALRTSEETFLRLANETLGKHREGAAADLSQTKADLAALLTPVQDTLKAYQSGLSELEKHRAHEQGALRTELKALAEAQAQVRHEAQRLTNALRSNAQVRGAWGEAQLRNVLEMAGLSPYADFEVQVHADPGGDAAKLRPDVIIRLPGGHCLVVDAKTPLAAFLDAAGEADDDRRLVHLQRHARALKDHARALGQKSYARQFDNAPDYVIMFVPGEQFVAAAMEQLPDLWVDAFDSGVLIATPTNLIAIARTVAQVWRQEKLGETARDIAALGEELYKRLATMGDQVRDVGRALDRTVKEYNGFVGSLEGRVMPQARRFTQLGVGDAEAPLPPLDDVDRTVRLPRADRDFKLNAPDPMARPGPDSVVPLIPAKARDPG